MNFMKKFYRSQVHSLKNQNFHGIAKCLDDLMGVQIIISIQPRRIVIVMHISKFSSSENERRFDQQDLHIIGKMEQLLLDACNGEDSSTSNSFSDVMHYLKGDVDYDRLKVHLSMLPDLIKTVYKDSVPVKKVTNLRTIAEAMEQSTIYKDMLSEVDKILKIFFTFPVTSATAERSFSSLRRLKTFLRSTMTDCRLNNLCLLYIHTSRTDTINLEKIAKDFIMVNPRRMNYFRKI